MTARFTCQTCHGSKLDPLTGLACVTCAGLGYVIPRPTTNAAIDNFLARYAVEIWLGVVAAFTLWITVVRKWAFKDPSKDAK